MHSRQSIRPFKLVKYFSYTSFFLILFSSLVLSFIVYEGAKSLILQKSEEYALLVAKNLNHQVFLQFTLPTVAVFGRIRLREKVQFDRLDRIVRNTIHGFDIEEVNIYDMKGTIAYSTNKELVGKKFPLPPEFQMAKTGKLASRMEKNKLKTYAPFRAEKALAQETALILGIFEITQDLSKDYKSIKNFYTTVIMSSVFIMGLLFLGLTWIVRRGERIIEARAEEERKLEDKLRKTEHLANLGKMVAAVSHEIKNPLGIISSTAELLQNRKQGDETQTQLAQIILEESRRLNQILSEFLEFARPEVPELAPCAVTEVIDKVLNFLAPEFRTHAIEVVREYKHSPVIEADAHLLHRAFLNIALNAIEAMPSGGQLKVTVDIVADNQGVIIIFADTGSGMQEEILEHIFTPFFTTKEKGSGLGLAIVKKIIENHEGEVKIESKIGEGTRVIVSLP